MQYAGPCEVVDDGAGGYTMKRNAWSLNQNASLLMVDNVSHIIVLLNLEPLQFLN